MERVAFALKRAFQGSLRLLRKMLEPYGLTPARFDMLRAIAKGGAFKGTLQGFGLYQSQLVEELGVTRMTVSRMARSLEDLGLITRTDSFDGRERWINFTRVGATILVRAMAVLGNALDLTAQRALTAAAEDFAPREHIMELLKTMRAAVGDGATLDVPVGPNPAMLGCFFRREGPRYGPPMLDGRVLYPFCLDDRRPPDDDIEEEPLADDGAEYDSAIAGFGLAAANES
jgi:DNA-binding MarR family transcriptional regulator